MSGRILDIRKTGIRNGETIIPTPSSTQNKNWAMKIRGDYKASKDYVNNLTEEEVEEDLGKLSFFRQMSPGERREWLTANSTPTLRGDHDYLDNFDHISVKFINIDYNQSFSKLTKDIIKVLGNGNPRDPDGYWPIKEVFHMIPGSASKGRKHTLVFRPDIWMVKAEEESAGQSLFIQDGNIYSESPGGPNFKVRVDDFDIYLSYEDSSSGGGSSSSGGGSGGGSGTDTPLNTENILAYLEQLLPDREKIVFLWKELGKLTPGFLKSLLQKLIRVRPEIVVLYDVDYPTSLIIAATFLLLVIHPGSFNNRIQRHVSGLESATKRLLVIIAEDSFSDDPAPLLDLLCWSFLARAEQKIRPTFAKINSWIALAIQAYETSSFFSQYIHQQNGGKIV
jgi:hypothetical protein